MTTNQTIDGVPREQMISFPRELSDELAELIAEKARVCGGGADEIWEAICDQFGTQAQPQGEPVAILSKGFTTLESSDGEYRIITSYKNRDDAWSDYAALCKAEQPAPVAVVLPDQRTVSALVTKAARQADLTNGANYFTAAEFAAEAVIDELKRLNPSL